MKKNNYYLFMLIIFCALLQGNAYAQGITVEGPSTLCIGECGTYEVVNTTPNQVIEQVAWGTSAGNILGSGTTLDFCPDNSVSGSTVVLIVLVQTSNGGGQTIEFPITLTTSLSPTIIPTIASCPLDSASQGACEKICAFGTAQYEVTGVSPSTPVTWSVQGAESFTPNGNTVTVEWGAPGQGQVSVVAGNSNSVPFQFYCGIQELGVPNSVNFPTEIYFYGLDGTAPYQVSYTINGVQQFPLILSTLPSVQLFIQAGVYSFTVTDATGQVAQCTTNIPSNQQGCTISAYPPFIIQPSNDIDCDGTIQLEVVGASGLVTYQWSNGGTSPASNQLCCGTYSVTVSSGQGCSDTISVQLACPTPTCSGETSLCVEILEEPEAQIGSLPPAANGTITICQGQTVFFQNQSTNATSYVWEFGNGNTSTQFEPSETYPTPGSYTVSLIARNECYCADTTFLNVVVTPADVPNINCVGTICEGETVTYSTDASCSGYTWSLTGSYNLLDGGGPSDNFITVEWLAGPEGTVGLTVSGCAGSVCNLPNLVPIPIVSDNVQILGPDKVCEGSTEEYKIPDYQGTNINWTVLGSGNITGGQGTERITVNWYGSANLGNPQRVIVEFDNCYLGCAGRDTLNVNIVPGFYAKGPIEVCASTSASYQSLNSITDAPMSSNWQLINQLGAVVWSSPSANNMANIPMNFPAGAYTVHAAAASAVSFCNDEYDIFIKIVAAPPAPTAIMGEDEICPGTAYAYEASGQATTDFTWSFTGASVANYTGNPATVTWNATGPYSVSVVQTATTGLACTSPPATLAVGPIPSFTITGDGQVCREQTGIYAVPFFENIDYQWLISPATAGTVISGAGTEQVEVLWHTDGPTTVAVAICGASQSYNVTVLPLPDPFVPDAQACTGQTVSVGTSGSFTSYDWLSTSGSSLSTAASPALGPGNYEVEVTDANGCVGDTIFEVAALPLPNISISTPSYYALCAGGPPATLYATEGSPAFNYQWQRFGVNVGTNAPTYVTTQPGGYQVIATDANGCSAPSNLISLVDCASIGGTCVGGLCVGIPGGPPAPGGGCVPAGTVDFSFATTADCSSLSFTNTSTNFVPGSFTWYFGDGTTSTSDNPPPHNYPSAGYYTVILVGAVNSTTGGACAVYTFDDVLVPVEADFEHSAACPGAPVQFTDRSVTVSTGNITAWSWDFGDPASGAANSSASQNPTHSFATPGTYNVTLTITDASGCTESVMQPVTVFTPPAVSFALPSASCENTSLPFDAVLGGNVASVYWDFGDPGSGDGNSSELVNSNHEFDAPGSYTVTLTALSVEGCTNSFADNITITPNTLAGVITTAPPSPLCEGESTTLTAPAGGVSWLWSNNSTINNITISQSGVYTVTLTNAEGCAYSPPPATVDVFGEPNGIIKAVEFNEFGQPVAFFENNHSVCEGDDVTLIVQGSTTNSYVWSDGSTSDLLEFTEDKGNLLPVGTHVFSLTVTDGTTGCTATEGPFTVTVNPLPAVAIASSPSGFICENTNATLSVVGPNANYNYQWNTGESGTSIAVFAGGTYFATAVNQFGCRNQSNEITLQNAPDVDLVPAGCHTRCQPDTMCLPTVPNVASFQWYLNGSPMAAPNGTSSDPIFSQSGEYTVVLTDVFGCTSTSAPLSLDLLPGFGDILGEVYFDVNQNGVIDAPDSLVSGINIFLNNGTANIDTVTSTLSTGYNFVDILSANYDLYLDTLNLPTGWSAFWTSSSIALSGCDVEEEFDWLLTSGCLASATTVNLSACFGSVATYNGVDIPAGASQIFPFTNTLGCDSLVTVVVESLPVTVQIVDAVACANEFLDYNGTLLAPGTQTVFTEMNMYGCVDTTFVAVFGLPTHATSTTLTACPGETVMYQGTQLFAGDSLDFTLQNIYNCDSVVTVMVVAGQVDTTLLSLEVCEGETVDYNGEQLAAGEVFTWMGMNQSGCDSVVIVSVTGSPSVSYALSASQICWNAVDGSIAVGNIIGSSGPYQFSLDGVDFQTDPLFENLPPGDFTVYLRDQNDCVFEEGISLTPIPPMTLEVEDKTLVCGSTVLLNPLVVSELPLTWEWRDNAGLLSTLPTLTVDTTGVFSFLVSNDCETLSGSIQVSAEELSANRLVYLPNAFSPNGDGVNDCFRGYVAPDTEVVAYELQIFDRWGDQLFTTTDIEGCWDGTFRGKQMNPAVMAYWLRLRVRNCDGKVVEVFRKGDVGVVR